MGLGAGTPGMTRAAKVLLFERESFSIRSEVRPRTSVARTEFVGVPVARSAVPPMAGPVSAVQREHKRQRRGIEQRLDFLPQPHNRVDAQRAEQFGVEQFFHAPSLVALKLTNT